MTDYLEQPEEQENALLEQAKRLEQALSAFIVRENEREEPLAHFGDGEKYWESQALENDNLDEAAPVAETKKGETTPFPSQMEGQKELELPLLEQLKQSDRVLEWTGEPVEAGAEEHSIRPDEKPIRRSQAEPWAVGRPSCPEPLLPQAGRGDYFRSGGREPLQSNGDLTWAEQTDRAFRRDSRRYDGGFYLY